MSVFDVLREKLDQTYGDIVTGYYVRAAEFKSKMLEIIDRTEQEFIPKTNADMIRRMTDEQLADAMLKFPDVCEQIGFCKNDILCNDTLDRGETIEPEMCKRCLMNWLGKRGGLIVRITCM